LEAFGAIEKMATRYQLGQPVEYSLPIGSERIPLNPLLGRKVSLGYTGKISCIHCSRAIKKSFSQGYCYPCFTKLAQCDSCIVRPELCHYAKGTCREPEWGETHCMTPHTVYLANSSAIKVGITREDPPVRRWIDQGASQGLAIRHVANRLESGHVEVALKAFVADKTNWRKMLQGSPEPADLSAVRNQLLEQHREQGSGSELPGTPVDAEPVEITYPVLEYPTKVASHNLDKQARLEGQLMGIKGQYLIFDCAVINMRKYGGYHLELSAS
jgi:hypothetical protein